MPWGQREFIQFGLLFLCVPLQYYLSTYEGENSDKTRYQSQIVQNVFKELQSIKDNWYQLETWKKKWMRMVSWIVINILGIEEEKAEESVAVEVMEYREKLRLKKIIKKSTKVHSERPSGLRFRVGQVVQHISEGYKGVIVEWESHHTKPNDHLYTLLVDERDMKDGESYSRTVDVPQSQLQLLTKATIVNRYLKNYFMSFDGAQYIPQPWLRELYPID